MNNPEFEARIEALKRRAHGQWTSLLLAIGVSKSILNGKNQPCPFCGGKDRFQYTDKFGEGNYFCRHCGPGGGLKLAEQVLGKPFMEVLQDLERHVGMPRLTGAPTPEQEERKELRAQRERRKIWEEARRVTVGDEVDLYLSNRGVGGYYPPTLRFHPSLPYYDKPEGQDRSVITGHYSAMLACVQGPDDRVQNLYRTYLLNGQKAPVARCRKFLSTRKGMHVAGGAVRLATATTELAVTEGIEKGLAVMRLSEKPVWAAMGCHDLEQLWVPSTVTSLWIYGDNDSHKLFAGQCAAFGLAKRVAAEAAREGRTLNVQVLIPPNPGVDWHDEWVQQQPRRIRKAA